MTDGVDHGPEVLHPTHHEKITTDTNGMNIQSLQDQETIHTVDGPRMGSGNSRTEMDIITIITTKVEEAGEVSVKNIWLTDVHNVRRSQIGVP